MDIEQQEIVNHALSSKENLQVAVAVGKSYTKLRELLIKDFSKFLERKLIDKEWVTYFHSWNDSPLVNYTGFTVRKESWPENIDIYFESQGSGGANYIIGIVGRKSNIADSLRIKLFDRCNELIGQGRLNAIWIWYINAQDKYRNFDNADTLFSLYEKEKFAAYLLAEIEKFAVVIDSELLKINPLH